MSKRNAMKPWQRTAARKGLLALVGSPFRTKQIEDGKEGIVCKFCGLCTDPLVSTNGNIHCGQCESLLYDGAKDEVR